MLSNYVRTGPQRPDANWRVVSIPMADLLAGTGWNAANLEQISFGGMQSGDVYLVDVIQVGGVQPLCSSSSVKVVTLFTVFALL